MKKKGTMQYKLQYNKYNSTIRIRMEEIYYIWDNISVSLARDILKKIYRAEFNELEVKDLRLVLHNLVLAEMEAEECVTISAKQWSKELVDYLNNNPKYIEINVEEYAKALNNYLYTHKGELDKIELETTYEYYYRAFEKYEYEDGSKCFMEKLIAKFNLNMVRKNYIEAFETLKGLLLHNNDTDYITAFEYCANELKEENLELYNQIRLLSKNKISKII